MSYADYVAGERAAQMKHEFVNGELFAKSGARRARNSIAAHTLVSLVAQRRGRTCEAFGSDMRVRTANGVGAYPDISVVRGEPTFSDADEEDEEDEEDELRNPSVLIELLSPTTEGYDRGEKFEHYRTHDSLREYVLMAPDRVSIDLFVRGADGRFVLSHFGPGESLGLESIGCTLAVDEVYEKSRLLER